MTGIPILPCNIKQKEPQDIAREKLEDLEWNLSKAKAVYEDLVRSALAGFRISAYFSGSLGNSFSYIQVDITPN